MVATHHPALLNLSTGLVTNVLVRRKGETTELIRVDKNVGELLQAVESDLGVSRAELLLMTRLFLFVEGPHDRAVLEGMFCDELATAGIRVIPFHGVDNVLALADSELLAELEIPMAVFGDATLPSSVAAGGSGREERAFARLVAEAHRAGRDIQIFGHSKKDILEWLDSEVCALAAPSFPGWAAGIDLCRKAGQIQNWKSWVTTTYGLPL